MSNDTKQEKHAIVRNSSESPPKTEPGSPVTWISAAETASLLHLSKTTVLNRAETGRLTTLPDLQHPQFPGFHRSSRKE